MTENKRFELEWRDTGEVLVDNETGREHRIYSPNYRFHVRDMMNELAEENKELKDKNSQLQETLAFRSNQLALIEELIEDLGSGEMVRQMKEILND
ncbi:MAG: hypothetical protein IJG19_06585 [Methanobrevibacter sp.]|nr:hypothetical protein [Methanobrevibacter sp.]